MKNEIIIETKICIHCNSKFDITDKDIELLLKLSPVIAWEKFNIPPPNMCPYCRKLQRLSWRNEKNLFKRKCSKTWIDIISIFPPNSEFTIYDENVWNSDVWDAKSYARDIDFSRSFFEQIFELEKQVPLSSKSSVSCENSKYCNACTELKNCYLCFSAQTAENTFYSVDLVRVYNSIDCFWIIDSENCYECIMTSWCYNTSYSYDIKNCHNSMFLLSCEACSNCYACFNIINKEYCIFNIEYSKEEYFLKLIEIKKQTIQEQKKQFEEFYKEKYIKRSLPNIWSENILESENIINSSDVSYSSHIRWSQNIRYCQKIQSPASKTAMDYTGFWNNAEKIYYSQQVWNNASNIIFSVWVFNEVHNISYSLFCRDNVHDCFWSIWLKNSKYCILNKQYSKEQYEKLVPQIIKNMIKLWEWWEFFPAKMSPFWYNHSVCNIIETLTEKEAKEKWWNWSTYYSPLQKIEKSISANTIPENIDDVPNDILNFAIECEVTKKPFKILAQELEFYRKHNLAIPKRHPEQRYLDKLKWFINY